MPTSTPLLTVTIELSHVEAKDDVVNIKYTCSHSDGSTFNHTASSVPMDTAEALVTLVTRMHKDLYDKYSKP